jgi:hypothetical protein
VLESALAALNVGNETANVAVELPATVVHAKIATAAKMTPIRAMILLTADPPVGEFLGAAAPPRLGQTSLIMGGCIARLVPPGGGTV